MKVVVASQTGSKRPRYFHGRLLTAQDFELEQQYIDGRLGALARATLGVGVVEGLVVSSSETGIAISAGVAVDALGRLIELAEPCTATLPAESGEWNVFVELDHEPCDAVPAVGLEDSPGQEASMLRDVIRVWLAEATADRVDDSGAVWLGRVCATCRATEVVCRKPRSTALAGG